MASLDDRVDTLETRMDALAHRQGELEKISEQLRTDQAETKRQIDAVKGRLTKLERVVRESFDAVHERFDEQTQAINEHVDERHEALQRWVLENLVDVARQWPASALVAVTIVLTIVATVIGGWLLNAAHVIHIG